MTRAEMLAQIGISDADFTDYLNKVNAFRSSLNPAQLALFNRDKPTVDQAAQSLGPNASADDVHALFNQAPPIGGIACVDFRNKNK